MPVPWHGGLVRGLRRTRGPHMVAFGLSASASVAAAA
jgi:hypothetical protein